jgi:hypothetical protein
MLLLIGSRAAHGLAARERRARSWARKMHGHQFAIRKYPLGIEYGDELAFADRLAFAHPDFLDGAGLGISIFIDSRIMISPSSSTLSPGLSWIFQTLPAISDFTLTTAMP